MHRYVGITIGPIFDTILDASSPAALWFASSLFSDAARRTCIEVNHAFSDAVIYSPYFGQETQKTGDGIGKFHDRIIFSTQMYDCQKMQQLILKVKRDTAACFPEQLVNLQAVEFLERYLQIHYIVLEEAELQNQNCILALSPYLDLLELMKLFPKDHADNVIRKLLFGEEKSGNVYIKKSPLFQRIREDQNQLKKDQNGLWTIEDIACQRGKITEKLKRKDYYAVIAADGDNMGKFLQTLENHEVTEFSRGCLLYDGEACKEIGGFGGMTIYAGGDDLLFLSPVVNAEGKSVFELCAKIAKLFHDKIEAASSIQSRQYIPTVSFGIAVQHKKYPLYEALANARILLDLAKTGMPQKNNMAIEVLKHSGRSIRAIVPNPEHGVLREVLHLRDEKEKEKTVHSVIYTLQKFKKLIFILNQKARNQEIDACAYEHAFMNLFDHSEQDAAEGYFKAACHTYWKYFVIGHSKICVPQGLNTKKQDTADDADGCLKTFLNLLLLKKFLLEKEGGEN
ncbi:MAG: hypothetical protein K2N87_19580 [Eubacterium sp.]|nr:hypothetical protein [Eubacterium sp.]